MRNIWHLVSKSKEGASNENNALTIILGGVYSVRYFLTMQAGIRRVFNFTGVCYKKRKKSFSLMNTYSGEFVRLNFLYSNPAIMQIQKVPGYSFRLKRKVMPKKYSKICFKERQGFVERHEEHIEEVNPAFKIMAITETKRTVLYRSYRKKR